MALGGCSYAGSIASSAGPTHSTHQLEHTKGEYHDYSCIDRHRAACSGDPTSTSAGSRHGLGIAPLRSLPPLLVSGFRLLGVPAAHRMGAPRIRSNWYGRRQRTAQRLRCWDQRRMTAADSAHLSDHPSPPAALYYG